MSGQLTREEYSSYDGLGIAELIASGQTTEAEVVEVARDAIETVDSKLNALAFPLFEQALEHGPAGEFHGVPFLLKDVGPYAEGVPFSVATRFFDGAVAPTDVEVMRRFRAAGLTTLGSTAVPEMAISFDTDSRRQGPTRNPWNLDRGVGGSSGGAAALVAAGAVPIAHAGDGAGSIRVPAASCGLVGLKPTRGRTPVDVDAFFGIAYEFALMRTIRDAAHLLDALEGPEPTAKYQIPRPGTSYSAILDQATGPLRVGLVTQAWSGVPVDEECSDAASLTARQLEAMGHHIEEVGPQIDAHQLLRAYCALTTTQLATWMELHDREPDSEVLSAVSMTLWREASSMTALDVGLGFAAFDNVCRSTGTFFQDYDLLITPTMARTAVPHGTLTYDSPAHTVESWLASIFEVGPFTAPFNIGGQPAISLPLAQSSDNLPIGVQLVAGFGREDRLLQLGSQLEQAMPWRDRRPPVHAAGTD